MATKKSAEELKGKKQIAAAVPPEEKPGQPPAPASKDFPVVGIGASAGGLEALETFFRNMKPDSGCAFVVVSHLDPNHASMMSELIGRYTSMPVREAQEGMRIEANGVYVIPPNRYLRLHKKMLFLSQPVETRGLRMPIDFFFRSLAEEHGERAICVILSGSGSDGTMGLSAIREAGGMSMVQSEESAKYAGMPMSAMGTGLVDYVLPVEKMPEQLMSFIKLSHPRLRARREDLKGLPLPFQQILGVIRSRTGHDFTAYKKSTILRHIERRMNVHETNEPEVYLKFLQEHTGEVSLLFKELLISVTNFFREPEGFKVLKEKILPLILEDKPEKYAIRVWVPGCATGEEVYSIAMIIHEYMDDAGKDYRIQIFGTDIDEDAINVARAGFYPTNIAIDVDADRLKRFFIKEAEGYKIKKELRESAVFALQNVIRDAPFTRLDLLSCRNLLIYFDAELQNKLLPLFHYSLKPGGFLVLGTSETIGAHADLFTAYDKKWKFYRKKNAISVRPAILGTLPWSLETHIKETRREARAKQAGISEVATKMLMEHLVPASLIVNTKGDILHVQGRTGKYLEPAQGTTGLNALEMARDGLQLELRSALHNAASQKTRVVYPHIRVRTNGDIQVINLKIIPVPGALSDQDLYLVVFEDVMKSKAESEQKTGRYAGKAKERIDHLERDLKYTKENLQATIEELQASNEELKSANEELQSANEELQSTNEELETSKEEMQSVNEELATVNSELQIKIEQLSRTENDMRNLLESTDIGIIFLDDDLRVKRFTAEAMKIIKLIPSDIGRPIGDLVTSLDYDGLVETAGKVSKTLTFFETEVHTKETGHSYLMRILPYRTVENVIDGVTITFTDVNKMLELRHLVAKK